MRAEPIQISGVIVAKLLDLCVRVGHNAAAYETQPVRARRAAAATGLACDFVEIGVGEDL
jgi:hypothetical protein